MEPNPEMNITPSDMPQKAVTNENLVRFAKFSKRLDTQFSLPGVPFKFGLDGLLGLVPGVGDLITGTMGLYALKIAYDERLPWHVHGRLLGNLALDSLVGVIPLVGDIFDFAFHAHRKNYKILERRIQAKP